MFFEQFPWYKVGMHEKKVILVVEDDESIANVIKTVLEEEGYTVVLLTDSSGVFESVAAFSPKLILLDIWMPGLDGLSITQTLKKNRETLSIPVVLLSATTDGKEKAKISGANDFIAKPFTIEELLTRVRGFVSPPSH